MKKSQSPDRSCSETEARKIISPDGASALIGIITGGWQDYLDEGRRRSRRTRAGIVWEAMIERADEDLKDFDGVSQVSIHGSRAYVLSDRLLMRLKKHDRRLRTSNVPTAVQRVLAQGYFDGMPDLAHITCGYILDKAEAGIERLVVVRTVRGKPIWHFDLRDLAAGNLVPPQPILPGIDGSDDIAPLPSIRRRAKDAEGEDQ